MDITKLIEILLGIAAAAALYILYKLIDTTVNKTNTKILLFTVTVFFILLIEAIYNDNQKKRQSIQNRNYITQKYESDDTGQKHHVVQNKDEGVYYFVDRPYIIGFSAGAVFSKCVFIDYGMNSCNIRCAATSVETSINEHKAKCHQHSEPGVIYVENNEYSESTGICKYHTTKYKIKPIQEETESMNCKLVKQEIKQKGVLHFNSYSYSFMPISKKIFYDFTTQKLRYLQEFRDLADYLYNEI